MKSKITNGATILSLLSGALFLTPAGSVFGETISLSGEWHLALDPENVGQKQEWYAALPPGSGSLELPGTLQEQGYGNTPSFETKWIAKRVIKKNFPNYFVHPMYSRYREDENYRFPYLLNPKRHYVGPAWYQRTVTIPESWKGQRISLFLERCHLLNDNYSSPSTTIRN